MLNRSAIVANRLIRYWIVGFVDGLTNPAGDRWESLNPTWDRWFGGQSVVFDQGSLGIFESDIGSLDRSGLWNSIGDRWESLNPILDRWIRGRIDYSDQGSLGIIESHMGLLHWWTECCIRSGIAGNR